MNSNARKSQAKVEGALAEVIAINITQTATG
jgi:hypothetical protein